MALELSQELCQAIDVEGTPLKLVDPRTGGTFVLIEESAPAHDQASTADSVADTYQAQLDSAMRAGWDDPEMDQYNDYDQYRRQ